MKAPWVLGVLERGRSGGWDASEVAALRSCPCGDGKQFVFV